MPKPTFKKTCSCNIYTSTHFLKFFRFPPLRKVIKIHSSPLKKPGLNYAMHYCSIQSCLFVQGWPRIFLVQCQQNLSNVSVAFAATGYCQKINWSKIKIAKKWHYSDWTFSCAFMSGVTEGQHCNVVPGVLRQYCKGFFLAQWYPEPQGQHCTGILPV